MDLVALENKDDSYLVSLVKESADERALLELMERHSGIFHQTVANFLPPSYSNSEREDVFEEKPTYFFEAITSFDETRGAIFPTWLANKTKYTLLSMRSKEKVKPTLCEFNEELGGEHDLSPDSYLARKDETEEILQMVLDKYGKQVYDIFKEKYFGGETKTGKTFSEIAAEVGVSPQAIQAKHKDALEFLKKRLHDF